MQLAEQDFGDQSYRYTEIEGSRCRSAVGSDGLPAESLGGERLDEVGLHYSQAFVKSTSLLIAAP